uniref:Probable serine/threonine-protein kinase DDB_G0282963 n=1 Tax=Dermatophagoides pteronyssinus TaxID=6956 RepID=A0A6P6Y5D8_DERPT|nr:probable serine/threonine-protein kinase DDB_G0282963 [Dermatophagoides pteronyssinus]
MSLFDFIEPVNTKLQETSSTKKISTNPFATNNNENSFKKYVNSLEDSEEEDEVNITDSDGWPSSPPLHQQSSIASNFLSTTNSDSQDSLILSTGHVNNTDKDQPEKLVKHRNIDWFIGSEQEIPDDELFKSATISIENESSTKSDDVDEQQSNSIDIEEQQILSSALAFDCGSPNSLNYFLQQNPITKLSSSINSTTSPQQQQLPKSFKKSYSSANIVSTGSTYCDTISTETSPIAINNTMNVASKKRGLFSRGSKTISGGSSLGTHATSSTSINDNHQEENGKINKTPSSPSGASHHFNELDEDRFNGDGVQFQGKLIGHEYVAEARGEQMCQQSLKKLKIIQKALGGHKRKINLFISFDGIKILDPQTNEELFHHSVPQISFISRDETDTRAFGYVFGNSQTGHQFIGIKTKKEAMIVMSTIGQLFAITLKRKRNAEQEQTAASVISSGEEHLYHSVPDQTSLTSSLQTSEIGDNNNDIVTNNSTTTKSRARIRTGVALENVPIPALPPPSEQHPRHRQHNQSTQQNQRFATIGRVNDINNNFSQQQKTLPSALINELDLFQPTNVTGGCQNLSASIDSSLPKDSNQPTTGTQRLASSYDWAHFDDDNNQLSIKDDSTLNTISSISDTLTFSNNQQTLNDSITLVAGQQQQQQQQQYSTNQKFQMNSKAIINSQNKLNVSSTTISSANFDGMDPFSDAFGSDPFSTASTTADISSNLFSAKTSLPQQEQQQQQSQQQNRPPSNPGPNTMFDSNKLSFKEMNSGSVPALTNSFGSLSLDKSQQSSTNSQNFNNNLFKSNVELSNQNSDSQADKYAVLADINSISTSIFDSLGNRSATMIEKEDNKNKTPTPPPITSTQQRNYPSGYPSSINNSQHQQQQQSNPSPLSYGVNGIVVLPPVSTTSIHNEYISGGNFSKNRWLTKSFDSNEMPTGRNINYGQQQQQQQQTQKQAPRAEFDSMSNLSSNSSNTSISNTQQQNQKKSTNETSNIPLFQELDPLNNKKRNSPLNFKNFNDNRNRSPMLNNPNGLDSSISSMNSSNSSLFNNSRNCSTPNSLQQQQNHKSPQPLLSHQQSLPVIASSGNLIKSQFSTATNNTIEEIPNNDNDINNVNQKLTMISKPFNSTNMISSSSTITTTTTITTSPHYIMLYNLSTSPLQSNQINDDEDGDNNDDGPTNNQINNSSLDSTKTNHIEGGNLLSSQNKNNIESITIKEGKQDLDNKKSDDSSSLNVNDEMNKNEENSLSENNNMIRNDQRSRTSSISSSSNSLLLQQENSNFSELKFDDVFETPLLTTTTTNDLEQNQSKESTKLDNKISEENKNQSNEIKQKNTLIKTKTESISSLKSDSSTGNVTKPQAATSTSLSRQSSTSSTPPAIPPRTDLHNNSNKYQNQMGSIPPPPQPPPSQIHSGHSSSYGNRIYSQQPYPPLQYPYYPSPPPSSSSHFSDPYIHRPNSSSSHHHPHLRYQPNYYDSWYCNQNDPIYSTPPQRPPLDYPPQIPPPPIPSNVPPNYLGYHDYYTNPSRPFSGGNVALANTWHEYYQHQQQQQQQPHSSMIHPNQLMSSSTLSLSSTTSAAQPKKASSISSTPPPCNNINNDEATPSPIPPPIVPNPQRRISATSTSSQSGGATSNQSPSMNLHRTPSSVSSTTERTFNPNVIPTIPMYPPPLPPTHQMDPFYSHPYYDELNKSSASPFAAFNMNMEQMIMKYHHPVLPPPPPIVPMHHLRNSPILPPYEPTYGYTNYQSYPGQYPTMIRGRNSSGHLYSNQLDITQQQQQQTLPQTSSQSGTLMPGNQFVCPNNSIESNTNSSNGSSSGYASTIKSTTSMMIDSIARISPMANPHQTPWPTIFPDNTTLQQQQQNLMKSNNNDDTKPFNDSFIDNFANFDTNQDGFDTVKRNQKDSLIMMLDDDNKANNETEKSENQSNMDHSVNENDDINNGHKSPMSTFASGLVINNSVVGDVGKSNPFA